MIPTDLFSFAFIPAWFEQLYELSQMAAPEPWRYINPEYETQNNETPIWSATSIRFFASKPWSIITLGPRIQTTFFIDATNFHVSIPACIRRSSEVGHMDATIPLTKDAVQIMVGSGEINGVKCEATATVSKMAASITVHCEAPVNTFLAAAPEGTDKHDMWVDVLAVDESGNKFRAQEAVMLDDSTSFTLPFLGTGTMPKTLTLYVYSMEEGIDDPDLTTLDGIAMEVVK